jgi:hypothetical protein
MGQLDSNVQSPTEVSTEVTSPTNPSAGSRTRPSGSGTSGPIWKRQIFEPVADGDG